MIRTILVDDELKSLKALAIELQTYCPDLEIIATYQSSSEALQGIKKLRPSLVFLDIQMPGMNGFELLQKFGEFDFHVIFVTAFDEYAVRAFEFNAIDYLMKPVRKIKLIQAVEKVKNAEESKMNQAELQALVNNLKLQQGNVIETLAIPTSTVYEMIHIDEIKYLHAQNNYTWIYRVNGAKHLVSKPIKYIEEMLTFPQFYRTHKSYVVNVKKAVRFIRAGGGYLVLNDETEIPVSRSKKEGLMRLLGI